MELTLQGHSKPMDNFDIWDVPEAGASLAEIVRYNIRYHRFVKDWSQQGLSHKAGLSPTTVSYWETGKVNPTLESIEALAVALGVRPVDMFKIPVGRARVDEPSWGNYHSERASTGRYEVVWLWEPNNHMSEPERVIVWDRTDGTAEVRDQTPPYSRLRLVEVWDIEDVMRAVERWDGG